jgi:hypothetical protein
MALVGRGPLHIGMRESDMVKIVIACKRGLLIRPSRLADCPVITQLVT